MVKLREDVALRLMKHSREIVIRERNTSDDERRATTHIYRRNEFLGKGYRWERITVFQRPNVVGCRVSSAIACERCSFLTNGRCGYYPERFNDDEVAEALLSQDLDNVVIEIDGHIVDVPRGIQPEVVPPFVL